MSLPLQCHGCHPFAWSSLDSDRCVAFANGIAELLAAARALHVVATTPERG